MIAPDLRVSMDGQIPVDYNMSRLRGFDEGQIQGPLLAQQRNAHVVMDEQPDSIVRLMMMISAGSSWVSPSSSQNGS